METAFSEKDHATDEPSGEYTVAVTVDGIENAKIVRNFERKVFPWEGNQLGKSDRLIPPFTPVKVNGNTVSTLLRDHLLSDMGLWRQVTADGADLLKEDGMRLEAVVNGKTYSAQGKMDFASPRGAIRMSKPKRNGRQAR